MYLIIFSYNVIYKTVQNYCQEYYPSHHIKTKSLNSFDFKQEARLCQL